MEQTNYIPVETRFSEINCLNSFNCLSGQESLYAYYFANASWTGTKVNFFQKSYESPALLYLILRAFEKNSSKEIQESVKEYISADELEKIYLYIAAFVNYCGNFRPFEDSKFVPQCSEENFVKFFKLCPYWKENTQEFQTIYSRISKEIFSHQKPHVMINFSDKEGSSGYYSRSVTSEDAEKVKDITMKNNLLSQNDRLIKVKENEFIIKVASVEEKERVIQESGVKITFVYGEFSKLMADVNKYLIEAQKHSANETQQKVLKLYIEHFRTGNMQLHKEAQKEWIKDVKPVVQTNIGFVETGLDPLKIRAQFQGFVSIANKELTQILNRLEANSPKTLQYLPWGKQFEKEVADRQQPNSMDNLTFASSSFPFGFDLPHYEDRKDSFGLKENNHGNSFGEPSRNSVKYTPQDLVERCIKCSRKAVDVFVSIHEVLGHGSGKLLRSASSFKNPLDGSEITTFYKQNEDFKSVFGEMAFVYEQIRANGVGLYMSLFEDIQETMMPAYTKQERQEVAYFIWYEVLIYGLRGLASYDFETKKWQYDQNDQDKAAWAAFRFLEEQGGVFEIKDTVRKGKPYFEFHMSMENIKAKGKDAIGVWLQHLQIYKSTADSESGIAFINRYLEVPQRFLQYYEIIQENGGPQNLTVQSGLRLLNGKVEYIRFEPTVYGCIDSAICHLGENCSDIIQEWNKNAQQFRGRIVKQRKQKLTRP